MLPLRPTDDELDRLFAFYDGFNSYDHRAPLVVRLIEQIRFWKQITEAIAAGDELNIEQTIKRNIARAWIKHRGNREEMSIALGISLRTLTDRMRKLGYKPGQMPISQDGSNPQEKEFLNAGTESQAG